ncbi:hypothetical protein CKAN_00533900 [Cinnamomum micranthum f. kanehirae]|uniref:Uncharacterized protein n=1 Tax=Cinnamomum micranthum f. kanehirae TaxID=337451 RepID=A0A443NEB0_9MAGN|nr:hypothetical protein CKAN_00533900 [Cinnamomum micranthum f. kanehirae]
MQRLGSSSLRNLLKPGGPIFKPSQFGTQALLTREPATRGFSTAGSEEEAPPPSSDPFLRPPPKSLVYGKLTGGGRNALKSDVIQFFEGCNLSPEDIKVNYNLIYAAVGMVLQFSSGAAFDMAVRLNIRKGRVYRFDRADRSEWDQCTTYDGKAVILQGIPRPATAEDVERFLSGCSFDASSIQIFFRPVFGDPIRVALVHFPSQIEAMNAFRVKNRGFCLNNLITMRVLQ